MKVERVVTFDEAERAMLRGLAMAGRLVNTAKIGRNELILHALDMGPSCGIIGEAVGMSPAQISRINTKYKERRTDGSFAH